jgi:hypothetical protein
MTGKATFNSDKKFDIQLDKALLDERGLAWMFENATFDGVKIEAKDETWQWRQTGNICVEHMNRGKASGIAATEADYWVHSLHADNGQVLVRLMFPVPVLYALARKAYDNKRNRVGGDGGLSEIVLIPVRDIITGKAWE